MPSLLGKEFNWKQEKKVKTKLKELNECKFKCNNKPIDKACNTVGVELDSLTEVSERKLLSKLWSVLDNPSHPLHLMLSPQKHVLQKTPQNISTCDHQTLQLPLKVWPSNFTTPPYDTWTVFTCTILFKVYILFLIVHKFYVIIYNKTILW